MLLLECGRSAREVAGAWTDDDRFGVCSGTRSKGDQLCVTAVGQDRATWTSFSDNWIWLSKDSRSVLSGLLFLR